jgi:cytidylate kinase
MTHVVAVDGPVAAGKGTLARRLAAHFGYAYLDTGSLYRATALRLLRSGSTPDDAAAAVKAAEGVTGDELDDPALRSEAVGEAASRVAAMPEVRAALLDFQRRFASTPPGGAPGAVLDGRDVGTVVCPGADAKLFVTANVKARAHRRYVELRSRGETIDEATVLADLEARDARDSSRSVAPLRPADDAHLLDTSNLDIDSAFQAAIALLEQKIA